MHSQAQQYCKDNGTEVIGRITFSSLVNHVLREGKLLVKEEPESKVANEIKFIWKQLSKIIGVFQGECNA